MNQVVDDILMHYGTPRHSGRYPYGSGEDPYQHARDFLGRVDEMRKSGFTFTDENGKTYSGDMAIAKSMGLNSSQFRTEVGLANVERDMYELSRIKSLREKGLGYTAIGRELGMSESTVRSKLNEQAEARMKEAFETADFIKARSKECIADGGMIDVGVGAERELGISKERMKQALYLLEREGYGVYSGRFEQPTNPGQFTTQKILCPPDIKPAEGAKAPKEIYELDRIHSLKEYISRDGGETYEKKFNYPESMDSSRLKIRYNEEGGLEKDGIVELRRGVADLSLGESRYSQVRILVDGSHYIKGMAVYSDDMPDGVDVVFNTNKKVGTPMTDVLKKIKKDPDNPFGSAIKDADKGGQYFYDPETGKHVSASHPGAKLGLINKRADEGDWSEWKDALPSQFLGKQSKSLIKRQLDIARQDKQKEFDEICALENPTVKKYWLKKFSDGCDSAAVNLQAAALPGQKYHVIIPINSLKDTEVFAPKYDDGTKLALVRYPHGGTFEIPILTVNNKNATAKRLLGMDVEDAVGITSKVAERLSGADFDGDTVMCIPTNDKVKITSTNPLKGLEGFDPKVEYGPETYKGKDIRLMTKRGTQTQMGIISNLITDMTLAGAKPDELAAAVRHSMVVIDAEKHKLNYKQSELDNHISSLHKKYQGKATGGAATILSRAKGEYSVDKRKGSPKVNQKGKEYYDPTKPEGALIWSPDPDATYTVTKTNKRTGEVTTVTKTRQQRSTKMYEYDDAYKLVSDMRHPKEILYADYANDMKALANRARMEMVTAGKIQYDQKAAAVYKDEVASLKNKLNVALLNATRERTATRMANAEVSANKKAGVYADKGEEKKAAQRAVTKYRNEVGAVTRKDRNIEITDREWEAIQAGAISENKLKQILDNSDPDILRQRAMPRANTTISPVKMKKIQNMSASNYTTAQIAEACGVSVATVSKYMKGVE